jgi:hypothetical protein
VLTLTPEARELMRAGRAVLQPSDADRERVLAALLPQLQGGPGAESGNGTSVAAAATKTTLLKALGMLVGFGFAGAGLFLALRPAPPSTTTAAAPATPPPKTPATIEDVPEGVGSVVPQADSVKKPVVAPHRANHLAQEVAILSRASAELHAGRPAAALVALTEHQRKFPTGVLVEERTAARVQALCALGRTTEARAELGRLTRMSPNSPHEARARKACGFAVTENE